MKKPTDYSVHAIRRAARMDRRNLPALVDTGVRDLLGFPVLAPAPAAPAAADLPADPFRDWDLEDTAGGAFPCAP